MNGGVLQIFPYRGRIKKLVLEDEKHMSWCQCTHVLASLSFSKANTFLSQPHKTTSVLWVSSYGTWHWTKMKTVSGWTFHLFKIQLWSIYIAFYKSLYSVIVDGGRRFTRPSSLRSYWQLLAVVGGQVSFLQESGPWRVDCAPAGSPHPGTYEKHSLDLKRKKKNRRK